MKPILLDLCCKAGGAARGYQQAGFYVVGVDIEPQPNYAGDEFRQADALEYVRTIHKACSPTCRDGFRAIHASPPCQHYIRSGMVAKDGRHPDILGAMREALEATGLPWVIENVPGAPMRPDVVLCGSMFDLEVRRHRWFESNVSLPHLTPPCDHSRPITGVYGHPHGKGGARRNGNKPMLPSDLPTWSRAMGIDWMTAAEIAAAIPPAYTEFVGGLLMTHLNASTLAESQAS